MLFLVYFAYLVMIVGFIALLRRVMQARVMAIPFLALMLMELITIWPATVVAYGSGVSNDVYLLALVLATNVALFAGYLLGAPLFKIRKTLAYEFHTRPVEPAPPGALMAIWLLSFAVLLAAALYTSQGIPPLWKSLLGGPSELLADMVRDQRLEATKAHYFGGEYRGQGVIKTLMMVVPAFMIAAAAVAHATRPSRARLFFLLGTVGLALLFAMSIGSRGPMVNVLLASVAMGAFVWRLRASHIIGALAVFVAAVLFVSISMPRYHASFAESGLGFLPDGVVAIVERVSLVNTTNTVMAVEAGRMGLVERDFAEEHVDKIVRLLPNAAGELPLASELTALRRGNVRTTAFATPTWLASTYLDFGLIGSAIAYMILGLLVAFGESWIFTRRKTVVGVAVAGVLTLVIAMAIVSSPLTLIPFGVVLVVYTVICDLIVRVFRASAPVPPAYGRPSFPARQTP
jgi:oligosaccharide repeat unit polymerase